MSDVAGFGHFSADVYRASQEEPTLMFRGRLYRGRLLSIEEWLPFAERMDALEAREEAGEHVAWEWIALYREYLRAVFPRRLRRFWWPDPVTLLMREPWGLVVDAISRFFDLQALAMRPSQRLTARRTDGTSSRAPTPAATRAKRTKTTTES